MACSYASGANSINSSGANSIATPPLELEHIPLTQRRNLLLHSHNNGHSHSSGSDAAISQNHRRKTFVNPLGVVVKMEPVDCDLQVPCHRVQTDARREKETSVNISSLPQYPTLCDVPTAVKVETADTINVSMLSLQPDFPVSKVKQEISEDVVDDLDHIVLKERQRMLLARKLPGLSKPAVESGSGPLLENIIEHTVEQKNEETYSADGKMKVARGQYSDIPEGSKTSFMQFDSHVEKGVMATKNDGPSSPTCPTSVKVKDESLDSSELYNINKDVMGSIPIQLPSVKSELEVHDGCLDDQVEHMCLIDRLNFIMSGGGSSLNISTGYSSLKKTEFSSYTSCSSDSESLDPLSIKRLRKRKRTATDSIQTALEEDAPGLLQVLLDKGVAVDEIKLYGEAENDEPIDESLCQDSFSELQAVISKIFSQRQSFIKFPIVRGAKFSRANDCLACLISLVEQTRYLQFRKWPVEWGWCRDLQSFIFVFEKHNRIVLERPEYGYATYFFELVQSLPVEWQIRRLVIAMKLTSCSRISLIENKELVVGEDLAEGEAKVLKEYGWIPNSGLGTMLNFCDRVVHDRKNEKDTSEWRSKIGKLLADGFNGGTIVMPNIPKKVADYMGAQSPSIKTEEF